LALSGNPARNFRPPADRVFAEDQASLAVLIMSAEHENNRHQEWSRFWESASGFWRGLSTWRIWLLCASLVAVVALQLYVQFRLNYWNRDFFDALESRNPERLRTQAILLIPLCGASVTLAVTSVWGRMTMQRK
jgi:putative ATP-binding cassette transporter